MRSLCSCHLLHRAPSAPSWGSRCPAGSVNPRPVSRCSPTQTCQLVSAPARPFPELAGLSRRRGDTEGSDWTFRLDLVPCPLRLQRGGPGVWMLSQPASPLGLSVGAGLLPAASPVAGLEICPPCCWLCLPAASHGLVRTQDQLPASSTSSVCRSHPWGAGGGGGSVCFSWEIFRDVEGEAVEQCCQVSLGGCVPPRPHQLGTGLSTESPGWALPRGHCEAASGGSQPPSGSEFDGNIHSQSLGWGCTMCEPSLGHAGALGWPVAHWGPDQLLPAHSPSAGVFRGSRFLRDPFHGSAIVSSPSFWLLVSACQAPLFPLHDPLHHPLTVKH